MGSWQGWGNNVIKTQVIKPSEAHSGLLKLTAESAAWKEPLPRSQRLWRTALEDVLALTEI